MQGVNIKRQMNICVVAPRKYPNHGPFKLENNEEGKHKGLWISSNYYQLHEDDWENKTKQNKQYQEQIKTAFGVEDWVVQVHLE